MQVKTKNIAVSVLIVLFVGLIWYRFVYSPMESAASKANAAAHDANVNADNLKKELGGGTSTKPKVKSNDPALDVMQAAIPLDAAESSFLRSIDQLRITSGADWQTITPTPPAPGVVSSINVGITVNGSEDELARYIAGLSDLPRIFVPDNVSITGASGSGTDKTAAQVVNGHFTDGTLQMTISGRIFSQVAAVSANSTTGAAGSTTPVTGAPAPTGTGTTTGVQTG